MATIIYMILGVILPEPRNLVATSRNAILALLDLGAPLLLHFIELKFQNESISVFEAHPITTRVALAALLLFSLSFGLALTFEDYLSSLSSTQARLGIVHLGHVAAFLRTSMVFSGSLLVASLASILFSEEWRPVIYVFYVFLSLANYLYMLVRKGCEWVHGIVNKLQTSFTWMRPWHLRRNPAILPLTISDTRHRIRLDEGRPMIYVIYIFLSLANHLYILVRRGCEGVQGIVNQLQTSFTGMRLWHQRGNPESLPITIPVTRHRSVQVQVDPQLPQV